MKELNRRQFLQSSIGGVTAIAAAAQNARSEPVPKVSPSERLQVGCVGVSGRAGQLMHLFAGLKDVDVVALADIDSRKFPGAVQAVEKIQGKKPVAVQDFRKLIDNPEIDALVVWTP